MYSLTYFGTQVQSSGTILEALATAGIDVGNNEPYVNGVLMDIHNTPEDGARVTFRPRQSGKAL